MRSLRLYWLPIVARYWRRSVGISGHVTYAGPDGLNDRLPAGHLERLKRKLGAGLQVTLPRSFKRFLANDGAAVNQLDQKRAVVAVTAWRLTDSDDLRFGHALLGQPSQGELATTDGDLIDAFLGHSQHRCRWRVGFGASHQLVDEFTCGVAAASDQCRANPVTVDRRTRQRRDRELIKIAGHDDPCVSCTKGVKKLAHLGCQLAEVAGIEPDSTKPA